MRYFNLMILGLSLSSLFGCTLDFDDFEPYTQPGAYEDDKPEPVDMDAD